MKMLEIAKIANVSHSTVSRVIRGNVNVSSDAKERVLKAIKQEGYVPRPRKSHSQRFQSIEGLKTGNIAVLLSGMDDNLIASPMIGQILKGIEFALSESGLSMTFSRIDDNLRFPAVLSAGKIDGVILFSGRKISQQLRVAIERFPCVGVFADSPFDCVQVDDDAVGRLAANYFIGKGILDLSFINACPSHPDFQFRMRSFIYYAEKAGAKVDILVDTAEIPSTVANLDQHENALTTLVERFLKLSPRPKGLFVPSDLQAVVICRKLQQQGLKVGFDMPVVSCDNWQEILAGLELRPVTIDINPKTQGELAVNQLFWRIKNPNNARVTLLVTPELVDMRPEI